MKTRILSLLLVFALSFAVLPQMSISANAIHSNSVEYEMREETVEFKLSNGTLCYTNTIRYPYFRGNSETERKLNQRYADLIHDYKENDTDFEAEYKDLIEDGGEQMLPFYEDWTVEVVFNKKGVLSLKEVYSYWSGGLHPYHYENGLNYEIDSGKTLTYSDILSGNDKQIDRLLREVFEEELWQPSDYVMETLRDYTAYTLTDDGLCFYYNAGDAIARVELVIPYTDSDSYIISVGELLGEDTSEASNTDISDNGYISAVQKAIEDKGIVAWGKGYGALYDVDGNGVEELLLIYHADELPDDDYFSIAMICSVYTMSGGRAIPLIEKEHLYYEAGSPWGYVGVVEKDGEMYLGVHSFNGGLDGGYTDTNGDYIGLAHRWGNWTLYSLDGTSLQQITHLEYTHETDDSFEHTRYEGSSVTIDGKEYGYSVYEEWVSEIEELYAVYPAEVSWAPQYENTMTLEDLLEYLKEHPVKDSTSASAYGDYARTEWIKQHMEYAASDEYQSDIVSGFSNRMLAVFRDALDDEGIQSYNARKALSAFLSIDVEFDDADMYELIIAQVLYGKESRDLAEQAFEVNYQKAMADITKSLVNVANSGDSVKELPQDVRDSINELYKLLQTLECGSDEYGKTLKTFFGQIKANGNEKILSKWKTELRGDVAFTGLGIVIDGAFEQYNALEDIAIYISNYMAYQNTSQQTREVLARLAVNVLYKYDSWYGVNELIDELGLWGSIKNWPAFQTALISVAGAMEAYEQDGAAAIAKYAVEREKEALDKFASKTVKTISIFAVEKALSCVPVINTILIAKNVVNAALIATTELDRIFTNVDDREYALDVLTKTYCISVMLDKTVEDCKDGMSEDDFYSTTVFDEAVSTYKRNLLLASGYAVKYAGMVLANAEAELEQYNEETEDGKRESIVDRIFESRDKLIQAVTWYTNSLAILQEQQVEIKSIACHDEDLYYNQLTDEITYDFKDSRIYIVACPVDVIVTDESGEQIAYLSGEENEILDGYEFYFHTIKIPGNSGEYIKVAIVPNHYRIEMKGTGDGVMHAFVADFTANDVGEVETYFNIPIEKDSEGYFEASTDDTNTSSLVMDQVAYSNMESVEDIPTESKNGAVAFLWIGLACVVLAIILIWRKKSTKLAVAIILIGILLMGIGVYALIAKGTANTKTEAAHQDTIHTTTESTAIEAIPSETQVPEIPEPETELQTEDSTEAPTEIIVELAPLQYWIEYCDTKRLAEEDLETFGSDECRLARNAIFAKSGRKFNDASLQAYYEQFDWYRPTVSPDDFSNNMLNDFQSYNLDLIIAYEESRGY